MSMERAFPCSIKFEDTTTRDGYKRHTKKLNLQEEIEMLQGDLEREQALNKILKTALQGSTFLPSFESSLIPRQVQVLLAELVWEEEQIITLERKVRELKLKMYQEPKHRRKWDLHLKSKQLHYGEVNSGENYRHALQDARMHHYEQVIRKGKMTLSGPI